MTAVIKKAATYQFTYTDENGLKFTVNSSPTGAGGASVTVGTYCFASAQAVKVKMRDGGFPFPNADVGQWPQTEARRILTSASLTAPFAFARPTYIITLRGQSNMSGRGTNAETTPTNASKIWMFDGCGKFKQAAAPLDADVTFPVDTILEEGLTIGANCGMSLADRLITLRPTHDVCVVMCAKGGTSTTQWAQNYSRGALYGAALGRIKSVLQAANATYLADVYYQGEEDSTQASPTWDTNFQANEANWRTDTGFANLKCFFAQLPATVPVGGSYSTSWATVRAQQASSDGSAGGKNIMVAAPNGPFIDASVLHLQTSAQEALGPLFANAIDANT